MSSAAAEPTPANASAFVADLPIKAVSARVIKGSMARPANAGTARDRIAFPVFCNSSCWSIFSSFSSSSLLPSSSSSIVAGVSEAAAADVSNSSF